MHLSIVPGRPHALRRLPLPARGAALALTLALLTASVANAVTTTDQLDYPPGSVVTLSGGNDGAGAPGYVTGANVTVDVAGPNAWTATCTATVGADGTWACTITLDSDPAIAVGDYTYTATSVDAAGEPIVEAGAFSDAAVVKPIITASADPSTATFAATVHLSGLLTKGGSALSGKTVEVTGPYSNDSCNGSGATAQGSATTNGSGGWSRNVTAPSAIGVVSYRATYDEGGNDKDSACATVSVLRALYVVPDARSISYGSVAPGAAFYTFTLHADSTTGATIASIATMPTCTSAYTATTPVGTLPISCSGGAGTGYLLFHGTATLTIVKAPSVVAVSCPASVTYTGLAQTPCTATATAVGISPIDLTSGAFAYTGNVTVGTASVTATWPGDANHDGSTGSATFAITKAPSVVTVTCPASVTYAAAAQTPCTGTATGVGMDPVELTNGAFAYTNNVNVGTASVTATWPGDANHDGSSGSGAFTIAPASIGVVVTGGTRQVSSGSPATNVTIEVTLDATVGDAATATITMTLTNVSGGGTVSANCAGATSPASGLHVTRTCSVASLPLGVYDVTAVASGNYTGTGSDIYTVYDPSLGFATGGGTTIVGGERLNFGFVMKYNKSGTNLQGGLVAVLHHADGTTSKLKSNALGGLVIQQVGGCGEATFAGKASYTALLGDAYVTTGGLLFTVVATDCTNPGPGPDTIRIAATGTELTMATASPLTGGQIAVTHKAR